VVFLWTSRSGLTQIIGLSQGLFLAIPEGSSKDGPGKIRLARPAATDLMLDKNGKVVADHSLGLEWSDLQARIQKITATLPVEVLRIRRERSSALLALQSQARETLNELTPDDVFARRLQGETIDDETRVQLVAMYREVVAGIGEADAA
jgi:hypothetical protein